jgi:polar amino acid transport system substrate-binding protein
MLRRMCLLLAVLFTFPAQAEETPARFRYCGLDIDYPPYSRVDGSGHLQHLVGLAVRSTGVALEFRVAPRRRCIEELKAGLVDGMIGGYSPERAGVAVFPMAGMQPDVDKSVATPRYYLYRKKGAPLQWNGERFSGQGEGRIGVESGFTVIIEQLRRLQVRYDDNAKSLDPNFGKLAAGRLEGVIAMEAEAERLIARSYAGLLERAGQPFDETPLYLMLSHQFHARHPAYSARIWQALQEHRASIGYRLYQQAHP